MRLSSIWTCSGALLTSAWETACNKHMHKHTRTCTCMHTHTPLWSPLPCQHPSGEIRRLETGQPWPMYIFMGLIWHHFSPLPQKETYLIYTIPVWPVHQEEMHIGKVGPKSSAHLFSIIYFAGVCVYVSLCTRVCPCPACWHAQQKSVCAKEKIEICHPIPEPYSRVSGSCASRFEWEDGRCTQQMLCVY